MKPSSSSASTNGSGRTRNFWWGYLIGGAAGAALGLLMNDLVGWIYMAGTVGCIVGITFDRDSA